MSFFVAAAALLLQACLLGGDDDSSSSTSIDGRWEWVRDVITFTDLGSGESSTDTVSPYPDTFGREFLLIEDSVVTVLRYDEVFGVPDTFTLGITWSEQQGWRYDGDSISLVRNGNNLEFTVFSVVEDDFGGYTMVARWHYKKHSGALPPSEWALTAEGAPAAGEVWLALRTIAVWEGAQPPDTIVFDTSDVYSRKFFRALDSVMYSVSYDTVEFVSFQRLDAVRWLDIDGDTLTISRAGNNIRVSLAYAYPEFGDPSEVFVDFIRYTKAFPPAAWSVELPAESEPNGTRTQADAMALGQLTAGALQEDDVDWYSFPAVAGQAYRIVTTGELDTYLRLYGAGGAPIEENDDAVDLNAEIIWTAPASGTYYFTVRGFGDTEEGNYRVRVSATTAVQTLAKQGASLKPAKRTGQGKPSEATGRSRRGR